MGVGSSRCITPRASFVANRGSSAHSRRGRPPPQVLANNRWLRAAGMNGQYVAGTSWYGTMFSAVPIPFPDHPADQVVRRLVHHGGSASNSATLSVAAAPGRVALTQGTSLERHVRPGDDVEQRDAGLRRRAPRPPGGPRRPDMACTDVVPGPRRHCQQHPHPNAVSEHVGGVGARGEGRRAPRRSRHNPGGSSRSARRRWTRGDRPGRPPRGSPRSAVTDRLLG